jgi:hypothetical protein
LIGSAYAVIETPSGGKRMTEKTLEKLQNSIKKDFRAFGFIRAAAVAIYNDSENGDALAARIYNLATERMGERDFLPFEKSKK